MFVFLLGNSSYSVALPHILTKGSFSLTTDELGAKREATRRWIINHLHSDYLNPKNDLPYSTSILEAVMEELRTPRFHLMLCVTWSKHPENKTILLKLKFFK